MKFGLTEEQQEFIKSALKNNLPHRSNVKIWTFGSRARGDHKPYSDLDLLIEASPPMDSTERFKLKALFEESKLPFTVDLVVSEDLEPSFLENVTKERVIFF